MKINKIFTFTAIALFALGAASTQAQAAKSGYYTSKTPVFAGKKSPNSAKKLTTGMGDGTDIVINNSASNLVNVYISGDSYHDVVYPNNSIHVVNEGYYGLTPIILADAYNNEIFGPSSVSNWDAVCRFAIISVRDARFGGYDINVNPAFC